MYQMKIYSYMTLWLTFMGLASACSSEFDEAVESKTTSVSFNVAMNIETRAAQALNPATYATKLYLYERRQAGEQVGYTQVQEIEVTDNRLTVEGLVPLKQYKAVFLAIPKGQTPALPQFQNQGTIPDYKNATAQYINGISDEIKKDVFRSIIDFKATTANSQQSTVLTRQNGALEVRLLNQKNLLSVKLHVNGHTAFYLHDGTGGQVVTTDNTVALENTITDATTLNAAEVRIRINLLPQEDLTDRTGGPNYQNYLEIKTTTGITTYPIKSESPLIPIFPNQVTWLTLGSRDNTEFDVSFSGNINLDDDKWDGIHQ